MTPNYISWITVKEEHLDIIPSKAHEFGVLLNVLLVWALCVCVQLRQVSDLQIQICRLQSRTVSISSSRWCSPKSATGTEIWDCWAVLIKLLKMVSNLSVKSAFDGSRMEVGKYSPSLLMSEYLSANLIGAIIKSGICMYKKKNKNKKKKSRWRIYPILYWNIEDVLVWSEKDHCHVEKRE